MITNRSLMVLTLAMSLSPLARAQDGAAAPSKQQVIEQREQKQEQRIQEGVKSGALTEKEAAHLEKREERIKKMEANALKKDGGTISDADAKKIEHAQNRVSADIRRKKHNKKSN